MLSIGVVESTSCSYQRRFSFFNSRASMRQVSRTSWFIPTKNLFFAYFCFTFHCFINWTSYQNNLSSNSSNSLWYVLCSAVGHCVKVPLDNPSPKQTLFSFGATEQAIGTSQIFCLCFIWLYHANKDNFSSLLFSEYKRHSCEQAHGEGRRCGVLEICSETQYPLMYFIRNIVHSLITLREWDVKEEFFHCSKVFIIIDYNYARSLMFLAAPTLSQRWRMNVWSMMTCDLSAARR